MSVSVGQLNFKDSLLHVQNGDITVEVPSLRLYMTMSE